MAIFSISAFELKRKADLGDARADVLYPLRAQGNELYISLVVGNVFANALIALMIGSAVPGDSLFSGVVAAVVITTVITVLSELVPKMFLQKYGYQVAATLAPYVNRYVALLHPISGRVMAALKHKIDHDAHVIYSTEELITMLEEREKIKDSDIQPSEMALVRNALDYGDKTVGDVMTPRSVISSVKADKTLTTGLLKDLYDSGHSRFPVYEESLDAGVIGILFLRDLVESKQNKAVSQAMSKKVYYVNENQMLDHVLEAFISTKHHLFIVINEFSEVTGLITIEDIIEEIMGREIVDEFDKFDNMREVAMLQAKKQHAKSNIIGAKKPKLN